MMPRLDSVCPMRAVSLRIRMWQPMAISHPPPSACPLMAATTGLGKRSMRRTTLLPNRRKAAMSGPEKAEPRSAPAQKILSPAPVMISDRTASSAWSSESAALSSRIRSSLMALAGGRFRVMTAKDSSRVTTMFSYGIGGWLLDARGSAGGEAAEEKVGEGLRGVGEAIAALAQHPRGGHLVHGAEEGLGGDLHRQALPEATLRHALFQDGGDEGEVGRDLVRRGPPEELLSLPLLHLDHLGQLRVFLQHLEVETDEPGELRHRVRLVGDRLAQAPHELGHLVAEERDEDVVLGAEVEIDGPRSNAGFPGDVGDARVVIALAGEDPNGRLDNLLGLLRIAHGG